MLEVDVRVSFCVRLGLAALLVLGHVSCGDLSSTELTNAGTRARTGDMTPEASLSLVDTRLVPMVERFQERYGKAIGNVPVQIRPLSNNRAGTCRLWYDGRREIIVSEQFYNDTKDDEFLLQATVFHELGHCVLDRDHDWGKTTQNSAKIYKSLMYPYVFSSSTTYEDHYDYYHDELFSQKAKGSLALRHNLAHASGDEGFVEACDNKDHDHSSHSLTKGEGFLNYRY